MKKKSLTMLCVAVISTVLLCACSNGKKSGDTTDAKNDANTFTIVNVRINKDKTYLKGFVAESEKEANVKIKWDTYSLADWGNKKSVVLGSGDLPDAFWGSMALGQSDVAQNIDSLLPLEEYINEETMPNLTAAMKSDDKLKALITNPDGHIYSLPQRNPGRPKVGDQLWINVSAE